MKYKKIISVFLLLCFIFSLSAETKNTTPEPYKDDEFPVFLKDLRRFEIVTLGSIPFVLMDTNLVYSSIDYFSGESTANPSPFVTKNYEKPEDFFTDKTVWTTVGVSVGIGLTDLIVQIIKRNIKKNNAKKRISNSAINITKIEDDPDAVRIDVNNDDSTEYEKSDFED